MRVTPPFWDRIIATDRSGKFTGFLSQLWTQWFEQNLIPAVQSAPLQVGSYANTTPLTDALTITTVATVTNTGLYLVSIAIQIVVAAGVASNLQLTLTWTSNTIVQTETFAAIVDGTDTDHQGISFPIIADGDTPVTINTTYVSNPANELAYNLRASVNQAGVS